MLKYISEDFSQLEAKCSSFSEDEQYVKDKGIGEKSLWFQLVIKNGNDVGGFCFTEMQGCRHVVISSGTYLNTKYRNTNYSDLFRKLKNQVAKEMGYSVMIATVDLTNIPAFKSMLKSGYNICKTFPAEGKNLGFGVKQVV